LILRQPALLLTLLTAAFASYLLLFLRFTLSSGDAFPFGDFFALWSFPHIALTQPAVSLFDPEVVHRAQVALGMPPDQQNPFAYPPFALLLLWPLGWLGYWQALPCWLTATCALYSWAVLRLRAAGWPVALAALLAPTTTIAIVAGQNGFLSAALLIGGIGLADRRPVAGGVLLGLLAFKPQLALLVPVALAAAGLWRCIAVSLVTVLVLSAAATVIFGTAVWAAWLTSLPGFVAIHDATGGAVRHMTTVGVDLRRAGLPGPIAAAGQAIAALIAAGLVWRCFRRGDRRLAIAALLVGTLLATPYAYIYDLPILAAAVVIVVGHRLALALRFASWDVVVLLAPLVLPAFLVAPGRPWPVLSLAVGGLFWLVLRDRRSASDRDHLCEKLGRTTGLEPATSKTTTWRSTS
jgi:hypothetical protein